MKFLIYLISLPFIYLVSIAPFWLLYRISDGLFFILYYGIGYRKSVVYNNLKNSFPEKSDKEIRKIRLDFYKYFCDLILETFKTLTIGPKAIKKMVVFKDAALIDEFKQKNQSILIAMGHWGNWEIGGARFAVDPLHKLMVVYHPLKNKYFNKLIFKMRTRLGNGLYAMRDTYKNMVRDKDLLTATAFIADQTPSPKRAYWLTFLNQETPMFQGMGKISKKLDYPIVYCGVKRLKRGRYELLQEVLIPEPKNVTSDEIIEKFAKRLELDIKNQPEIWLWTHKRWKHKPPIKS